MSQTNFIWPIKEVLRTVDGDTVHVLADHGKRIYSKCDVRLMGLDAPERHQRSGRNVGACVRRWFEVHHPATFMLHSIKVDKFGRILGDIRAKGKKFSLCAFLLSSGMAKVYEGKRRQWEQDELDSIYVTAEEWLAKTNDEWLRLESASAPFPS